VKSTDYLDAVKHRHGLESDYQLAKVLGVGHSTISHYRTGRSVMDATMCVKLAELLAVPAIEVIAAAEVERATRPEVKKVWLRYAAAVALGVVGLAGQPQPGQAAFDNNQMGAQVGQSTHMRTIRRRGRNLAGAVADRAASTLSAIARYARVNLSMMAF
jgi:transcriptional regulator with XRE-family HTH domain